MHHTRKIKNASHNKTIKATAAIASGKRKFVIGIVSVPLTPTKKYFKVCGDSYIASSHISWLKSQGIETIVIPYDTKDLEKYFNKVHGLYLPSGGAFAGTQMEYYRACKKLMIMAMKENDRGNYFPVWGCCMGFQQMLIIADGKDDVENFLQKFDSYNNLLCAIKLTEDGKHSKIMNGIDDDTHKRITTMKCTLNNHMLGITPAKFKKNPLVNDFYKIVGTSSDRKGREFVAIIEGHHYPFYGVQWHPERNGEMNALVRFFGNEVKKNKKPLYTINQVKKMQTMKSKKVDCFNYSNSLYKKCTFFWHKRTSEHNKKLCSAAQLASNDTGGGV
jgi:gamma-glutamyl-gamma-aminobutyrate hydrolase PuuD